MDKRLTGTGRSDGGTRHNTPRPTLSTGSGKNAELSLKIITPEGADEDWEMDSFWEDDNEEAA